MPSNITPQYGMPPTYMPQISAKEMIDLVGAVRGNDTPATMPDIRTLPTGIDPSKPMTASDPFKGGQVSAATQAPVETSKTGGILPREVSELKPAIAPMETIQVPTLPAAEQKTPVKVETKPVVKSETKAEGEKEKEAEKPLDLQWLQKLLYGLSDVATAASGGEAKAIPTLMEQLERESARQEEFKQRMSELAQGVAGQKELLREASKYKTLAAGTVPRDAYSAALGMGK